MALREETPSLADLHARLLTWTACLIDCEAAEERARRETTLARNEINKLQKAFDTVLADMRKHAPHSTDWKRQPGIPV